MNEAEKTTRTTSSWRLGFGVSVFILSIIMPIAGISIVTSLDLSVARTSAISGVLLISAEVLGILSIAIMGKPGYLYIKSRVLGLLKKHGPAQDVSRLRYNIGLLMFCLPLVFGWLSVYAADYIPAYQQHAISYAIFFDLLLLASLFVLGGNFWDKIRALFIHNTKVRFAKY